MELSSGGFIVERTELQQFGNAADRSTPKQSRLDVQPATQPTDACQDGSGCTRCNSLTFSQEFYDAFKMLLCNHCRRQEKLVSKSTAKQEYGLTDGDLKKLGSVRRANPQRKDWHPMQLYLQAQVEEVSRQKHGGEEGLEGRHRALLEQKLQGRVRKREEEKARAAREEEKLQRVRRRVEEGAAQPAVAEAALPEGEVEQI